jgi:hypothetical protein
LMTSGRVPTTQAQVIAAPGAGAFRQLIAYTLHSAIGATHNSSHHRSAREIGQLRWPTLAGLSRDKRRLYGPRNSRLFAESRRAVFVKLLGPAWCTFLTIVVAPPDSVTFGARTMIDQRLAFDGRDPNNRPLERRDGRRHFRITACVAIRTLLFISDLRHSQSRTIKLEPDDFS